MAQQAATRALGSSKLFSPLQIGCMKLEHRVVMAPLGRLRAKELRHGEWIVDDLVAEYYGQRASKGGFQLTESTSISRLAAGYPRIAGIFSDAQVESWKKVTSAVHAKGGYIFCQIWHAGRATIPEYLDGETPVSSSAVPLPGNFIGPGPKEYEPVTPRALKEEEIAEIVQQFAVAAVKARTAGFDGVEIHGANGYLLEQFLHDNINRRTDKYGGSIEGRSRFPLDVIRAVTTAIGADRTGIRLSPFNYWHGTRDSDPMGHWLRLCQMITSLPSKNRPAYVHMIEPRFDEILSEDEKLNSLSSSSNSSNGIENGEGTDGAAKKPLGPSEYSLLPFYQELKQGGVRLLSAGNYGPTNALPALEDERADAVVFGRNFIANPDLPKRLALGLPLNPQDRSTFYGANPPSVGYTDYPFYECKDNQVPRQIVAGVA